ASACVATTRLPKQAEACTPATPPPLSGFLTMLDHTLCAADFALRKGFAAARANLGMFQSFRPMPDSVCAEAAGLRWRPVGLGPVSGLRARLRVPITGTSHRPRTIGRAGRR